MKLLFIVSLVLGLMSCKHSGVTGTEKSGTKYLGSETLGLDFGILVVGKNSKGEQSFVPIQCGAGELVGVLARGLQVAPNITDLNILSLKAQIEKPGSTCQVISRVVYNEGMLKQAAKLSSEERDAWAKRMVLGAKGTAVSTSVTAASGFTLFKLCMTGSKQPWKAKVCTLYAVAEGAVLGVTAGVTAMFLDDGADVKAKQFFEELSSLDRTELSDEEYSKQRDHFLMILRKLAANDQ